MLIHLGDISLTEKATLRRGSIISYHLCQKRGREYKVSRSIISINYFWMTHKRLRTLRACREGTERWAVGDKSLTILLYLLNVEPSENVSNSKNQIISNTCWKERKKEKKEKFKGCLAGSISRADDSWSQGCEFEPHVGCGDYWERERERERSKIKHLMIHSKVKQIHNFFLLYSSILRYGFCSLHFKVSDIRMNLMINGHP